MLTVAHDFDLLQGADSWFELGDIRVSPMFYPRSRTSANAELFRVGFRHFIEATVQTGLEVESLPPKIWSDRIRFDLRHIGMKGIIRLRGETMIRNTNVPRNGHFLPSVPERIDRTISPEEETFCFLRENKVYEASPVPRLLYETKADPDLPVTRLFVRGENCLIVQPTGKTDIRGGSSKGYLLNSRSASLVVPVSTVECMPTVLSPQGRFVAVATRRIVIVYLAEILAPLKTFDVPNTMSLVFTPDETILACVANKKTTLLDIDAT